MGYSDAPLGGQMCLEMIDNPEVRSDERRAAKRYSVRLPVIVKVNGTETAHMTVNASAGGLLVRPKVEGTEPSGAVTLDVGAFASDVPAIVVGHRRQGTALRFADAAAGEQIALAVAEQAQRSG